MGVAEPTGGYAERMLNPGGWPDVDEQACYDRAQQYTQVLRQVTDILETCQRQRAEIFEGGIWSGSAASAANGELGTLIDEMKTLQNGLATVITWHKYVAETIVVAKSDVTDNVVAAHRTIESLENDAGLDADERSRQINTVVSTAHGANVRIVDGTAAQILVSKSWKPPANALQDLLDQKTPPPVNIPSAPAVPPSPRPVPITPGSGGLTPPASPGRGGSTPPGTPAFDGGGLQPTPVTPPTPGQPGGPQPLTPVGPGHPVPGGSPGGGSGAPLAPATPAVPLSPAAGAAQPGGGAAGGGKGVAPAAASAGVLPASATPAGGASSGAHAGATGMPAGAMGSGGAGGSSGTKSGAPVGQSSADKSSGTKPAASSRTAGKSKPRAQPLHAKHFDDEEAVVVMPAPVIPVSAARAERDAVAEAATADASRRAGPDPLQLARRIGAALNAPGLGGEMDLGFFWVTGVTTDGAIVVANSYGLGYIPEGVQLPEKVHLASGDEAIPATDRARWATYPVMAVLGWADHHDKMLRAVIGTEQQLANSDAGVATIVLTPDDIPDTGDMIGRSRLEVVDSEAADRVAATGDARLVDLLPPAPAGAEAAADAQPAPAEVVDPQAAAALVAPAAWVGRMGEMLTQMPAPAAGAESAADDRFILWFEVMKPLASNATGRQAAHLRAFQTYAACAEEAVLSEAHAAPDPAAQRSAIEDWLYWKHLAGLLNAALADPGVLSPA